MLYIGYFIRIRFGWLKYHRPNGSRMNTIIYRANLLKANMFVFLQCAPHFVPISNVFID